MRLWPGVGRRQDVQLRTREMTERLPGMLSHFLPLPSNSFDSHPRTYRIRFSPSFNVPQVYVNCQMKPLPCSFQINSSLSYRTLFEFCLIRLRPMLACL